MAPHQDRRKKCSGTPERKKRFPYRPKDAPRAPEIEDNPKPTDPRFAELRAHVMQRKDDAERTRLAQLEEHSRKVEKIENEQIRRRLDRELAERQREIDDFWRTFYRKRIRAETPASPPSEKEASQIAIPRSHRPIAAYRGSIRDRRGRIGVFMSATYLAAKTTAYGCLERYVYYITHPDSVEWIEGEPAVLSNMGDKRHEMAAGMMLMEDANRAARANAKVGVLIILQLPYDGTPEQRLEILRHWCEANLAAHDLPYVASLHKPSEEGDQRNFHAHVVTTFRPGYRVGDYAWVLGKGLRTDLDNPDNFERMRESFASIMTAVVQLGGKDRVYTHLSHAARGLKHKPTEKLGSYKTKLARSGAYVPANERNRHIIAVNEAHDDLERIAHRERQLRRRLQRVKEMQANVATIATPAIPRPDQQRVSVPEPSSTLDRTQPPSLETLIETDRSVVLPNVAGVSVPTEIHHETRAPVQLSVKSTHRGQRISGPSAVPLPEIAATVALSAGFNCEFATARVRGPGDIVVQPLSETVTRSSAVHHERGIVPPGAPSSTIDPTRRKSIGLSPAIDREFATTKMQASSPIGEQERPTRPATALSRNTVPAKGKHRVRLGIPDSWQAGRQQARVSVPALINIRTAESPPIIEPGPTDARIRCYYAASTIGRGMPTATRDASS